MLSKTIEIPRPPERAKHRPAVAESAVTSPLPAGLAFTERAAAAVRAALLSAGLDDYCIFYNYLLDAELDDLDDFVNDLDANAKWQRLPGLTLEAGANISDASISRDNTIHVKEPGFLRLDRYSVAVARWFWFDPENDRLLSIWLCAAPKFDHYARLRAEVRRLRHAKESAEWRIVKGGAPGERVPRSKTAKDRLLLTPRVRDRVEAEIVRFFGAESAAMHAALGVPYRRGALMYGPPGNGKTSLIRWIGERLPSVPGMLLRPGAGFDRDDLASVFRRWIERAPAILVIEDLDSLLETIDVSAFLNLIDGIDSAATGGLLLLATTNHPEKLDPAINNRPGRFDVVIEVPSPDESLRLEYLRKSLPAIGVAKLEIVAADSEGLGFAHLQEIVRLSGLLALNAGRSVRTEDDVMSASARVRESYDDAVRGFPGKPEIPFGLAHLHRTRRAEK